MPTNRRTLRRASRRKIDDEVLRLWYAIRQIAADPVARERCHREFIDLNCDLCRRLGIWWGHLLFPIDTVTEEPPEWLAHNGWQADAWRAAYRWRTLLEERASVV